VKFCYLDPLSYDNKWFIVSRSLYETLWYHLLCDKAGIVAHVNNNYDMR